jgi:glycosyltransferase involved in cell wall biosynthesis
MAKVLIRGPLLTQSGYGVHSRQVFKWLLASGHDVTVQALPWGMTPWYLNPKCLNGLVGDIMRRTSTPDPQMLFDYSFQIQLPDEWDPKAAKVNIGITAAVETNFCNPQWVEACNQMDGIIVPSEFTKNVLENSGQIHKRVEVIPESIPENFQNDLKPTKFIKTKTKRNFLLFGQLTAPDPSLDRKNTTNAIKWFCEKYKDRKDVGLIVKTNMGTNSTLDKKVSLRALRNVVDHVRSGKYPKVHLLHGNIDEEELFSLYNDRSLIGLISATRGEGYGLPMIEAAAAGLPVLATDWSGHKTFLEKGCWIPVNYSMITIPDQRVDNRIFMQNAMWADPDEEDFKHKLSLLQKSKNGYKKKAIQQRETIISEYSQSAINKLYDKFIDELL